MGASLTERAALAWFASSAHYHVSHLPPLSETAFGRHVLFSPTTIIIPLTSLPLLLLSFLPLLLLLRLLLCLLLCLLLRLLLCLLLRLLWRLLLLSGLHALLPHKVHQLRELGVDRVVTQQACRRGVRRRERDLAVDVEAGVGAAR